MKKMKKLVSFLLTMVMVLSMAITGFAETYDRLTDTENKNGTITINDAIADETYSIYEIFYLESYDSDPDNDPDTEDGVYSYTVVDEWSEFVNRNDILNTYIVFDEQNKYVSWVTGADAATFAKLAQAYAKTNKIAATASQKAVANSGDDKAIVEFKNLDLGYYLVDTTLGTLCSLDSTNPDVEMYEKNEVPEISKVVQEDSKTKDSTGGWAESDDAQIGDIVYYKTAVSAKKGAQNYIVHDKMSEGLTFNKVTAVKAGDTYLEPSTDKEGKDYSVVKTGICTDCDFHVVFTQDYLDTITENIEIVIEYNATLNKEAVIYPNANTNDTKLTYGDDSTTEWQQTKTYTFTFDIVKTDSNLNVLDGAEFELYDALTGGNKIPLVKVEEGVYRVAMADERTEGFESEVIKTKDGKATVKGLDGDKFTTYYLEETNAPDGYNKLQNRVEVKLEEENLSTTMEGNTWADSDGGVHIINKSGTELPSTGGSGTTIFYVLGGIFVLAAGVLLVTRKRMNMEEE